MYKGTNGFCLFVNYVTLLNLKLCHKVQTSTCKPETCIRVQSIWEALKY